MRKTLENSQMLYKKMNLGTDRQAAWPEARQALESYAKGHLDGLVKDFSIVTDQGQVLISFRDPVTFAPKTVPVTDNGKTSLLAYLDLVQVSNFLNSIVPENEDQQIEINDLKKGNWKYGLLAVKDKPVRFHTATINGTEVIQHVSSSKWGLMSELKLFNLVEKLSGIYNFSPRIIQVDQDSFRIQLVQENLRTLDPTNQGGQLNGLIDLTISEVDTANSFKLGVYQRECGNGIIFGESDEISFQALKGAKLASEPILKAFFEAAELAGLARADVLTAAKSVTFEETTNKTLAHIVRNHSAIIAYRKVVDRVNALAGMTDVAEVVNVITRAAHTDTRLTPIDARRLELVAGSLLHTVTA